MLANLLNHWAVTHQDQIALICNEQKLNWQELNVLVQNYSKQLKKLGVNQQTLVTVISKDKQETILLLLAAQYLGALVAVVMPDTSFVLKDKLNTLYSIDQTGFIFCSEVFLTLANAAKYNLPRVHLFKINFDLKSSLNNLELNYPIKQCEVKNNEDQLATIIFTSGSTASPKAVVHSYKQHFLSAEGLLEKFFFAKDDTWLLSLPLYHIAGIAIIYRWLFIGAQLKTSSSGGLLSDLQGVTHASLVAAQLYSMVHELPLIKNISLQRVLLGGSSINFDLLAKFYEHYPDVELWVGYGMTEAGSTICIKKINALSLEPNNTQPLISGTILTHRELKIIAGQIYLAGDTLAQGYYYQGQIKSLLNDEQYFATKDLGYFIDNEVVITGRADNVFISGGENIQCEEIERALATISDVYASFVFPIFDLKFGARAVAVLQTNKLLAKEKYDKFLLKVLAKFKLPVAYFLLPQDFIDDAKTKGVKINRIMIKQWLKTQITELL